MPTSIIASIKTNTIRDAPRIFENNLLNILDSSTLIIFLPENGKHDDLLKPSCYDLCLTSFLYRVSGRFISFAPFAVLPDTYCLRLL
jgi:hypothetical protein